MELNRAEHSAIVEALWARLPGDIGVVRAWPGVARERYLNDLWEREGVPRSVRREVLRAIGPSAALPAGLTYSQISTMSQARGFTAEDREERTPVAPQSDDEAFNDYWQALSDLAQFLKGMKR